MEKTISREEKLAKRREKYAKNKDFYRKAAIKYFQEHKEEINRKRREDYAENREEKHKWQRAYYQKRKEAYQAFTRKYNLALRKKVIEGYGGKCACCGENHYEFLALDHVNGGGNADRRIKKHVYAIYRDALKRNFPPEYQILCHNCNDAKGFYGYCPHNLSSDSNKLS